ncbi:hypothetical protein JN531_003850 [Flagellatimonas centrodinii]|uniref:hypothetical protein n=1 Tax=Flagellatimonas centrodinii TaxID=2806210 RepID=UPI001FEF725C|nr:hypothetical protein [Flagellatimonas centrodinii]ULQ47421.1 hypothetical protein JN531_003850 [Flagellatimonas centrodinii]
MDATTARTLNIRRLVSASNGPTAFANRYGGGRWTQAQVSQWVSEDKPKSIGGRLARDLEAELGLLRGELDQPPADAVQADRQPPSRGINIHADVSPDAERLIAAILKADRAQSVSPVAWRHLSGLVAELMAGTSPPAKVPTRFPA